MSRYTALFLLGFVILGAGCIGADTEPKKGVGSVQEAIERVQESESYADLVAGSQADTVNQSLDGYEEKQGKIVNVTGFRVSNEDIQRFRSDTVGDVSALNWSEQVKYLGFNVFAVGNTTGFLVVADKKGTAILDHLYYVADNGTIVDDVAAEEIQQMILEETDVIRERSERQIDCSFASIDVLDAVFGSKWVNITVTNVGTTDFANLTVSLFEGGRVLGIDQGNRYITSLEAGEVQGAQLRAAGGTPDMVRVVSTNCPAAMDEVTK